jgi:uncharacterized repeat protein (TIGR01451 family)
MLAAVVSATLVVAAAVGLVYLAPKVAAVSASGATVSSEPPVSRVSLPLFFEPNQGQTDARVKFLARGSGYGLFLTADEAVLKLQRPTGGREPLAAMSQESTASVIRMRLDGAAHAPRVTGAETLAGKSNYFIGNNPKKWRSGIPQFARVNYQSVYPGIDLAYYGNQGQLEYDFRIAPGANPSQIALHFDGASTRLDAGELVLATPQGDVRFHAPYIYQQVDNEKRAVAGSFRQLAENKVGFEIGSYDRSRELVIDPVLTYATYLGGGGVESFTQIAVDVGLNMYVAASTTSSDFPVTDGSSLHGTNADILVAKINPAGSALIYATYLGGTGTELAAGIAVIPGQDGLDATVAGTTTSSDFPFTPEAFQTTASGTHGFLTKLDTNGGLGPFAYSTYLAGNGTDTVTGLAIDRSQKQHAFVTGTTTSTNSADGFPSTTNAYQPCPFQPGITCTIASGPTQFFASQINTAGTGKSSMLYSTYFGGNNPTTPSPAQSIGSGIAVDASERMYFTGSTNMLGVIGPNGENPFPLLNAQQSCLDEAGLTSGCAQGQTKLDAILVKINPAIVGTGSLVYSTYLGGSSDDFGHAVSVDSSGNAYVTGETFSNPWNLNSSVQTSYGGAGDAFIAKVTNPTGTNTIFPLTFFTYLGGSGEDTGQDIVVDNVQAAHVTGWTASADFPVTATNNLPPFGGATDAFVALISSTGSAGNYRGLIGGSGLDQGTSIALDPNLDSSPAFVAGITQSGDFLTHSTPLNPPLQNTLKGSQDAFVAQIGSLSQFVPDVDPPTVNPSPASVGNQVTFTFVFDNDGPDPASNVVFQGLLPSSGFTFSSASSTPGGTCQNPVNATVTCPIGNVAQGAKATVTVVLIPTVGTTNLTVTPKLSANGGVFQQFKEGTVQVTDFAISADPKTVTITAGESTSYILTLTPKPTYANTITVSHSSLPTASTGTFTSSSVTISGNTPVTTTLNISTTARPVQTGQLQRGGPIYATWLPIGGLSLLGLGAGLKRRRWLAGTLLGLLIALVLWLPACGNSSSTTPSTGGTPAGTYTITLTGASGSISHNYPVTLIVQ